MSYNHRQENTAYKLFSLINDAINNVIPNSFFSIIGDKPVMGRAAYQRIGRELDGDELCIRIGYFSPVSTKRVIAALDGAIQELARTTELFTPQVYDGPPPFCSTSGAYVVFKLDLPLAEIEVPSSDSGFLAFINKFQDNLAALESWTGRINSAMHGPSASPRLVNPNDIVLPGFAQFLKSAVTDELRNIERSLR